MNAATPSYNAAQLFHDAATLAPDHIALTQDGKSVSFGVLLQMVQTRAAQMQMRGISIGSKVLVFVPMSIALYRDVLALLYLGACPVFLDQWVSSARLKAALQTVPPDAMIATPLLRWLALFVGPLRRIRQKIPVRMTGGKGNISSPVVVAPDATALVTFTTGSTGIPKAADRTHAFLRAQYEALKPHLDAASGPVLTLLPIVVLINLAMGSPTLLPPKSFKAATRGDVLLDTLKTGTPQTIVGSPAPLIELARAMKGGAAEQEARHVRHLLTGGGAVWPDEAAELVRAFPRAAVRVVYGSTEAEPIASIAAEDLAVADAEVLARHGLPVGRVDAAARVAIIPSGQIIAGALTAAEWEALSLPPGSTGEIAVTGAHVLKSYLANPAAVRRFKVVVDDAIWHRTGDLGRMKADGSLYLLGRDEDTLWVHGAPVYPMIAERFFHLATGAKDAALALTNGGPVMAVVRGKGYDASRAGQALADVGLDGIRIQGVRRIPKDPRHRTKVDRAAMTRAVQNTVAQVDSPS